MQVPVHSERNIVALRQLRAARIPRLLCQGRQMQQEHQRLVPPQLLPPGQGHVQPQQLPAIDFLVLGR